MIIKVYIRVYILPFDGLSPAYFRIKVECELSNMQMANGNVCSFNVYSNGKRHRKSERICQFVFN